MDIIKAEFDWISLLVVVVAGIIGLIKSATKKAPARPAGIPREYTPETEKEETVEWLNDIDIKENFRENYQKAERFGEVMPEGDYYKQPEKSMEEEKPLFEGYVELEKEAEREEAHRFNIRQAVISSEILRRPEY